jgi:hypothetical protein
MAAWTSSKAPSSSMSDLAAAALLGRRAEHPHRQAERRRPPRPGPARPPRGGGDDVVPAGVADVGQGVVLGADGHHQRPGPTRRLEARWACRRRPVGDREPAGPQRLGRPWPRPGLVEAQLGRRMDRVAEAGDGSGRLRSSMTAAGGSPWRVLRCPVATSSWPTRSRRRRRPGPTDSPGADPHLLDRPAFSAFTLFSIFMASSRQMVWPTSTVSPTATRTLTMVPCMGTATVPEPAGRGRRLGSLGTALGAARRPGAGAATASPRSGTHSLT